MTIADNLRDIRAHIESAKTRRGTNQAVKIIAVTKTHPFSIINACYNNGIRSIGENRVQEAIKKFQKLSGVPMLIKRFIGHLQTNKVNRCLDYFDTVDSVDSVRLAKKISDRAKHLNRTIQILLEVNTTNEEQKNGFLPEQIGEMLYCSTLSGINIEGLMTVGPLTKNEKDIRRSFGLLRKTKEDLNSKLNKKKINELSMGMSNDFQIAVEEGSTMIRIGTALFGKRR
jgi:pyridoxal phosphate enzyme (YggS family)|tara:strand:- start:371 stop:1054 length:684 start_codon:yes stop_codon:yes gene_type:complete